MRTASGFQFHSLLLRGSEYPFISNSLRNKLRPQCADIAFITDAPINFGREPVSEHFAGNKMNQNIRYALLAGTMLLPAMAVPQAGMAADGLSARSSEGAGGSATMRNGSPPVSSKASGSPSSICAASSMRRQMLSRLKCSVLYGPKLLEQWAHDALHRAVSTIPSFMAGNLR